MAYLGTTNIAYQAPLLSRSGIYSMPVARVPVPVVKPPVIKPQVIDTSFRPPTPAPLPQAIAPSLVPSFTTAPVATVNAGSFGPSGVTPGGVAMDVSGEEIPSSGPSLPLPFLIMGFGALFMLFGNKKGR